MSSIGGVTCSILRGNPGRTKIRVSIWEIPGVAGYGVQWEGLGDSAFALKAIFYSSPILVDAWAAALAALQGSSVTIVDDWGVTHLACLLTDVGNVAKTPATHAGGCRGEIDLKGVVLP